MLFLLVLSAAAAVLLVAADTDAQEKANHKTEANHGQDHRPRNWGEKRTGRKGYTGLILVKILLEINLIIS